MIQRDKIDKYLSALEAGMRVIYEDFKIPNLDEVEKTRMEATAQIYDNLYFMDTIGRENFLARIIYNFQDVCFYHLNSDLYAFSKPEYKKEFDYLTWEIENIKAFIIELKMIKKVFVLNGLKNDLPIWEYAKDYENRQIIFENDKIIFDNLKDLQQHADKVLKGNFIKKSQRDLFIKQFAAIKPDEKNKVDWLGSDTQLIRYMVKIMNNKKRNVAYAKKIFNRPDLKDNAYNWENIPEINKLFR